MSEKSKTRTALVLIACGIFMMMLGFLRGETAEVFRKAVHVCLECIGIG